METKYLFRTSLGFSSHFFSFKPEINVQKDEDGRSITLYWLGFDFCLYTEI